MVRRVGASVAPPPAVEQMATHYTCVPRFVIRLRAKRSIAFTE